MERTGRPAPSLLTVSATIVVGLFSGLVEGVNIFAFVTYCVQRPNIFRVFANLTALNALLFMTIWFVSMLLHFSPSGTFSSIWASLFSLLWVIPMYIITILLGLEMWENLYTLSAAGGSSSTPSSGVTGGAASQPVVKPDSSFHLVSESIIKLGVRLVFGLLTVLIEAVPLVGLVLSIVMQSWLDAFLCFEYRFNAQFYFDPVLNRHRPLRLSVVLRRFEAMWPYYLGFGLSHVAARYWMDFQGVPYFVNLAVCSVMFAVNVVTTVPAMPGPEVPAGWRPPIFTPLYAMLARFVPGFTKHAGTPTTAVSEKID